MHTVGLTHTLALLESDIRWRGAHWELSGRLTIVRVFVNTADHRLRSPILPVAALTVAAQTTPSFYWTIVTLFVNTAGHRLRSPILPVAALTLAAQSTLRLFSDTKTCSAILFSFILQITIFTKRLHCFLIRHLSPRSVHLTYTVKVIAVY